MPGWYLGPGQGGMMQVTIKAPDHVLGIGYNTNGRIKVMPSSGQMALIDFQTGESFGNGHISLK